MFVTNTLRPVDFNAFRHLLLVGSTRPSLHFPAKLSKPSVDYGTLLLRYVVKCHAHSPTVVFVDRPANQVTLAAAMLDTQADLGAYGKSLGCIDVTAIRTQLGKMRHKMGPLL
jgi:hypothetical protein